MSKIIIVFDLDDTLINFKMKTPRQTYHMLNRSWSFYYISANPNITKDFIIKYEKRIRFEVLSENPLTLMNEL